MTKANLISTINGFITSVVNITKHRNSMLSLINEFFSEVYAFNYQSGGNVVQPILTSSNNNLYFNGTISKKGNYATINARFRTLSNSVPAGVVIGINNTEFYAKTGTDTNRQYFNAVPNGSVEIRIVGSTIQTSTIPAFTEVYFQLTYPLND